MRLKPFAVFAVAVLLVVGALSAQTTGTLIGNVRSDGAALPGVTVTVASPQLQGTRVAVSDINGNYRIGALPPGPYTVVFELEGMQTVTRNVNVNVSGTSRADAALKLSAVSEAITVTAEAPAVLETTEIQTTIKEDLVESLPMGRTIAATVQLAPGVNDNGVGGNTIISGGPSYDNVYYVDGAVVNENLRGQPQNVFIEDAIQETTVLTGGISAEYGRFTGGVVNTITKSGGNEFEGSFRDSFTNPAWRETYPTETEGPDGSINEVYEATLGGYIMKDRLWFFTAGRYFDNTTPRFFARSNDSVDFSNKEKRIELKLTGQLTPNHSLVGTYFDLDNPQTNYAFGTPTEASSLTNRNVPQKFWSVNYHGILSSNFLIEGLYANKDLRFVGSGGPQGDFVNATNVSLRNWGSSVFAGAPTFGTQGGDKIRASKNLTVKSNYYLSTASLGTHNVVLGYDDFHDQTTENNYQSGSDFTVWTFAPPSYDANGKIQVPMLNQYGYIIWFPVLEASQGSDFRTQSLFLNDKWDFNSRLSFNLGARYDKNNGKDQSGKSVADDSKVSPRLSGTYDVFGNGRLRVTATYAEYVSKIAGGNVGDNTSAAASPSYLFWLYGGPDIAATDTREMLAQVWDWFQSEGGVKDTDWLLGGGTNGIASQILGTLKSPGVDEFTIGVGGQIGTRGFVRVDYQNRQWNDFYVSELTLDNPYVFDPLYNGDLQVTYTTNANDLSREYNAVLLQSGYRFTDRLNLGANYTWSRLTGNYTGETSGSGPVTGTGSRYQPELLGYPENNPVGLLAEDRTHKLTAWVSYDQPTRFGNFNLSLLQNYNSGAPYGMVGTIDLQCGDCRPNPGYQFAAQTGTYYFEDPGAHRLDAWTRTDFALNYSVPVGPVELFFQGEMFNVFNEDAVINVDTTVYTEYDDSSLAGFDPFTQAPVEGVNYVKGPNYGQPVDKTTDWQVPRSWRFSAGLRF